MKQHSKKKVEHQFYIHTQKGPIRALSPMNAVFSQLLTLVVNGEEDMDLVINNHSNERLKSKEMDKQKQMYT